MAEGLSAREKIVQRLTAVPSTLDLTPLEDDAVIEYLESLLRLPSDEIEVEALVDLLSMFEGFESINEDEQIKVVEILKDDFAPVDDVIEDLIAPESHDAAGGTSGLSVDLQFLVVSELSLPPNPSALCALTLPPIHSPRPPPSLSL
jgi:hypothetical protein